VDKWGKMSRCPAAQKIGVQGTTSRRRAMKLNYVRVFNYKCYRDTGEVPLGKAFTVLVGQNNSGKTAFLECLSSSSLQHRPHRTPVKNPLAVQNPISRVGYSTIVTGSELLHRFLSGGNGIWIPFPGRTPEKAVSFLDQLFSQPAVSFALERQAQGAPWNSTTAISHQMFPPAPDVSNVQVVPSPDRQSWQTMSFGGNPDGLPALVGEYLNHSIYSFRAERMNVGQSNISPSAELFPNAGNLPSVLLQLDNNPVAHDRYLELVQEVFPSIYRVTAAPVAGNQARITVIMTDSSGGKRSPGIDVALDDSGTGISQVLAILYVAVTAPAPRIILIDEPNSFLHPGAAKKLLSILGKMEHQYVISTHSPDVIRAVDPEFLHLIEWQGTEAAFRTLERTNVQSQRRLLEELGISLSDVFGADNVIWVEGVTEHRCFPLLLAHRGLLSPATVVVPLVATGDLEGKRRVRADLIWQVYERLSAGTALVPPTLAFSLDREGRTAGQMSDLSRRSKGAVKFLPRRTFENYLLDGDAISAVLNEGGTAIAPGQMTDWLREARENGTYAETDLTPGATEERWILLVNAPKVLSDIFSRYATVEYTKTMHSVALTKWLLANKPDCLNEVSDYVAGLVAPEKLQD